ncbi:conserved hypothetical protein [Syntrophobacter sp. SbD1]|nr:conserved hypothetical protein [Syntrophobacter sp. SbD1]
MPTPLLGALIEYGTDFLGPIPNVVIFQFNPESIARTIVIPPRAVDATQRETSQAGEPAYERFTINTTFSAADQRNSSNPIGIAFGVGPQLAALQAMVYPVETPGGIIGAVVDAVGSLLGAQGPAPTQPIPRQQTPRILFIWGLTRIVPVIIESLTITERIYDGMLNPIEAQVAIGLAVITPGACSGDTIGQGALAYTKLAQDTMATINLANSAASITHLIPF